MSDAKASTKSSSSMVSNAAETSESAGKAAPRIMTDSRAPSEADALARKLQNMNMKSHSFWNTQLVPGYHDEDVPEDGFIDGDADFSEKFPKDPYPLIDGFEWSTLDMDQEADRTDLHKLLENNYAEDDGSWFRLGYSPSFLTWALKAPGWRKYFHVGVRTTESRRLVAFISGSPNTCRIRNQTMTCGEINFMCIHKKLRSKKLAPVLIREISRRLARAKFYVAIYTGLVLLPKPVSTCQFYQRILNWQKVYEAQFARLPQGSTIASQVEKRKLPEKTMTLHLRPMKESDVPAITSLLNRYLDRFQLVKHFNDEETKYWFIGLDKQPDQRCIYAFVVEQAGTITDFISFYRSQTTNIKFNKDIEVANLYYYATDVALQPGVAEDKSPLRARLSELINDAFILAKKENFDVVNALSLLDNRLFLNEQKFEVGDGKLFYYLYNYRAASIPGGIDGETSSEKDPTSGVGLLLF